MNRKIAINKDSCIGCSTCALTCSILFNEDYDINKAHIRVTKHDFQGKYDIEFLISCKRCFKCAEVCPTGSLKVEETS
ncbi:4Fe-4S dicluster domain-containing protein [Clostridium bovifaecis]|uniref:4Fe-4S dicluster domain-containing protein n=1 Tax=Clostridium bovifaecis TaxID=2184719 RepID=A0A6I6EPS5_9CLOT|nr:4Fe-4S dicluster domain-containing protein [Clostridium bovifaecis]